MKFSLLLVLRQYRRAPLRSAFLFGGMLCAVGLICGTMFGAASLNHGVVLSADSAAAPLIHRAAQLLTLLVAFFAGLLLKNSFLITLQQRMQMLGRLCALGMPRRQMGWMLLWEALLGMGAAFLVGAPLSALALGGLFRWLNASPVVRERFGLLQLWVPPATVLFCAVCCVAAALVSVRKPWQILRAAAPVALLQGRNAPARRPKPPTRWPLGQGFAAAYGRRDLQQRGAMFRPLAVGLAACVVLVMACQAFVGGMALLYDQRAATYAYRVYLHSENGSVPDALWQQLAEAAPEMDTVRVEELNAPAEGGMFRLLILEDAAFAAWYGQGLPLSQDGLPYIRADAVSDGPEQAPPMAGTQPVMVGRQPSPLPLGIGRIPEEDHVTVGVTARSVFDQRVPDPRPGRSLVVYYDAADGRLLTPRLTALLDAANCRYTIQDYTPTSDWARQRQAIGLLLVAFRACFALGVLLLGGLETFTVLYAQLLARRREFALLRSLGLPERTLYGTVFATGAFCLLGGVLAGLAGGAAVSALIARALALPWAAVFPLGAPAYCALAFGAAGALAVFAALGQLRRIPASRELRQE